MPLNSEIKTCFHFGIRQEGINLVVAFNFDKNFSVLWLPIYICVLFRASKQSFRF